MKNKNVRILTQCAVMTALAFVLALFSFKIMPNGGSITPAAMVPIALVSIFYGTKWGIPTAIAYSLLQIVMGFYPPPAQTFWAFVAVIFLDYIFAFGSYGLAGIFSKMFKSETLGAAVSAAICTLLRYLSHFLSGVIIWDSYCWEGWSVWLYSLAYSATYMIPELVITTVATALIIKFLKKPLSRFVLTK